MTRKLYRGPCTRNVEFRAVQSDHGDGRTLEGHAAVFNQPTEINSWEGHFNETIAPGAFKKTLRDRTPIMQFDHGRDARTGSVPIAAIQEAKEDGQGLYVRARMFDNPVVEPIRQAIEGGAINGMSYRFEPVRDEWTDAKGQPVSAEELPMLLYGGRMADQERLPLNVLRRELKVHELGPVVNPAYQGTDVSVRSADELTDEDKAALIAEYQRTMVAPEDFERSATFAELVDADEEGRAAASAYLAALRELDIDGADIMYRGDDPKKPYGDVEYADPGYQKDKKKRYPIDTKEHAKAAWSYINKASNAAKYSADQLAKIKDKIQTALKGFGVQVSDDDEDDKKTSKNSAQTSGAAREGTPASTAPKDAALPGTSVRETPPNPTPKEETKVKTKAEIEARQAAIDARLREFAGFGERSLEAAEQTEYDGLVAERAANTAELDKIQERQSFLSGLAQTPANTERGSDRGAPSFHKEVDPFDISQIRMASVSEEDFNSRLQEGALRAIEKVKFGKPAKTYSGAAPAEVASELFESIDHPELLAKRMLLTGSPAYERAFGKLLMHGNDAFCDTEERQALIRAQALGTDSAGGFAVPFQLDPTVILTNAGVVNPIRDLARVEQITGKQWQGVTSAGVTVSRDSEGATASDNSFTLAQPTLSTNRVQGFVPFNIEVDLAWGALRSEITRLLVDGKQREEDSFITGDGTGTNPFGVVGYVTGLSYTTTASVGTFAIADVYSAQAALSPRWEANSSWLAHKAIYHKLRQFDTSNGNALWARIGDGQPPRLLDYPDYRSSAMSNTVATGNVIMMYGDFSQFLIVDRIGMNVELVPHLFDPANGNRPTGQRGVYAIWMNNAKRLVDSAFVPLKVS